MQSDEQQNVNIAVLLNEVSHLKTKIETVTSLLKELQKERDHALRWGIMLLGTVVLSMASWIFKLFSPT